MELFEYEAFIKTLTEHRQAMDDVIIHGDFKHSNLLFNKTENGTIGDHLVAMVDLQEATK